MSLSGQGKNHFHKVHNKVHNVAYVRQRNQLGTKQWKAQVVWQIGKRFATRLEAPSLVGWRPNHLGIWSMGHSAYQPTKLRWKPALADDLAHSSKKARTCLVLVQLLRKLAQSPLSLEVESELGWNHMVSRIYRKKHLWSILKADSVCRHTWIAYLRPNRQLNCLCEGSGPVI